jgi:hypothetical protein
VPVDRNTNGQARKIPSRRTALSHLGRPDLTHSTHCHGLAGSRCGVDLWPQAQETSLFLGVVTQSKGTENGTDGKKSASEWNHSSRGRTPQVIVSLFAVSLAARSVGPVSGGARQGLSGRRLPWTGHLGRYDPDRSRHRFPVAAAVGACARLTHWSGRADQYPIGTFFMWFAACILDAGP